MKPIIYKTRPNLKTKVKLVDAHSSAIAELFYTNNPKIKKGTAESNEKLQAFLEKANYPARWIYYKDDKILIKTVSENDYYNLRTSRNKNLITTEDQYKFRNLTVGIAGLSVGSCVLSAIVTSGGPKKIKIADFDNLEITNLNRIKAKLKDIGENKIKIAAKEVWEIDPDAQLTLYENGITEDNLFEFLTKKPKLDVFIDEMDNLSIKIKSRILCKKYGIPVIMATDNGDSVILDVERFDLEPKRKIFHGLLGNNTLTNLDKLSYSEWLSLATKIIGPEYLTTNMQRSLLQIGKTISAVPQLGATASVAGAAISFVLRKIASGEKINSGRYKISLEENIIPNFFGIKATTQRNKKTREFKLMFGKSI